MLPGAVDPLEGSLVILPEAGLVAAGTRPGRQVKFLAIARSRWMPVGLNVGDVFAPDGTPRSRVRIRPEIAKEGHGGDPPSLLSGATNPAPGTTR